MRRRAITAIVCAASVALSGCYGSYMLTESLYEWNGTIDNKYGRSAVFWVFLVVPVYTATLFIDTVVLNVIEFWTGQNPLALKSNRPTERLVRSGEKLYRVVMANSRITISQVEGPDAGTAIALMYDERSGEWRLDDGESVRTIVAPDYENPARIKLFRPDGEVVVRNLEERAAKL